MEATEMFTDRWMDKAAVVHKYNGILCLVAQSCLALWDVMDCSPPGSSVHRIFQARILEWVAMPSSRGSSSPRDRTQLSSISGRVFKAFFFYTQWLIPLNPLVRLSFFGWPGSPREFEPHVSLQFLGNKRWPIFISWFLKLSDAISCSPACMIRHLDLQVFAEPLAIQDSCWCRFSIDWNLIAGKRRLVRIWFSLCEMACRLLHGCLENSVSF